MWVGVAYDESDLRDVFRLAEVELKRREDDADLKAEMAGLPNGKMARFLGEDHRDERRHGRSGGDTRKAENLSRLQMLLVSNPAYARAYAQTFDAMRNAEKAAAEALAKLEAAHAKAERELQDMLDHAARLPDGRRVFKDQHGQVRDEHGARVSELEAATIQWRGDEPAWENFEGQRTYTGEISRGIDELRGVQVDLGDIREEMTDKDHPPSEARMGELGRRFEELDRRTQDTLNRIRPEANAVANPEVAQTAMLTLPPAFS